MNINFSVALIARNEEKTLPRLLNSLKEFKDKGGEILLLDTGSTDNTAKVARELGCIVHEVGDKFLKVITNAEEINNHFIVSPETSVIKDGDKLFDFASARNYIADFASNDMLATPDCDEIYTKFDLDKVCEVIASGAQQLEYNFVFSHDEYGNEAVKFTHCKFYNRTRLKWVGIIHEVLEGNADRIFLDESIIKLEHFQNHGTNRGGYLRGLALDCFQHPNNDRNSHYFARELLWNNRPLSAIKEFKKHITMNGWPMERAQSMIYIGDAYGMIGQKDLQSEWYFKAFNLDSTRREALIKLGYLYKELKNPLACKAIITASMCIPETHFYGNDTSNYTYTPHELLYWSNGWLGLVNEARYHLDQCLFYKPDDFTYLRDFRYYNHLPSVAFIIPTLGREEGLARCIKSIKDLNYPQDLIKVYVDDEDGSVPEKVDRLYKRTTEEYVVYASNDCEFTPNSLIIAVLDSSKNHKGLIAFDTGVRNVNGYICEHFMIHKTLVERIGQIFDTDFHHYGVDDLLWHKCNLMNESMLSRAFVNHYHYSRIGSGIQKDDINKMAEKYVDSDRELLYKKLLELGVTK